MFRIPQYQRELEDGTRRMYTSYTYEGEPTAGAVLRWLTDKTAELGEESHVYMDSEGIEIEKAEDVPLTPAEILEREEYIFQNKEAWENRPAVKFATVAYGRVVGGPAIDNLPKNGV